MHSTLKKWLTELEADTEIKASSQINEEAQTNMVCFGFNRDSLLDWGQDSLVEFLKSCAGIYASKSGGLQMVFYSWLDEQAGQIRISAVSQLHSVLPFGCKVHTASLSDVVNGIYASDSGLYTRGALDVWQQNI